MEDEIFNELRRHLSHYGFISSKFDIQRNNVKVQSDLSIWLKKTNGRYDKICNGGFVSSLHINEVIEVIRSYGNDDIIYNMPYKEFVDTNPREFISETLVKAPCSLYSAMVSSIVEVLNNGEVKQVSDAPALNAWFMVSCILQATNFNILVDHNIDKYYVILNSHNARFVGHPTIIDLVYGKRRFTRIDQDIIDLAVRTYLESKGIIK